MIKNKRIAIDNWFVVTVSLLLLCACNKQKIMLVPITDSTIPTTDSTIVSLPGNNPNDSLNKHTYLALGDSYTIGQSIDSIGRFHAQTAALLSAKNIHFTGIQYIAATGWTTLNLLSAIEYAQPQAPFAAVTLLIGVNDQHQNGDTINYRSHFTQLLDSAVHFAGNNKQHVFVLSIPDYGVTPYGVNYPNTGMQINEFNAINKSVTEQYKIAYADVTIISRNDAGDATMLAPDGLHPSGKQYAQWAAALEPLMEKGLQ